MVYAHVGGSTLVASCSLCCFFYMSAPAALTGRSKRLEGVVLAGNNRRTYPISGEGCRGAFCVCYLSQQLPALVSFSYHDLGTRSSCVLVGSAALLTCQKLVASCGFRLEVGVACVRSSFAARSSPA